MRQKRWDWYQDDFSARLKPDAKRILMNTLARGGRGGSKSSERRSRARVISIPAVAEENDVLGRQPGEYLWDEPEGYNYAAFLRARQRDTSPMMWAALYQQRPAPRGRRLLQSRLAQAIRCRATKRDTRDLRWI